MVYHDDLLDQAFDLATRNPVSPTQADLRRAVSGAYYALFHLLINDAVLLWQLERSRMALSRNFDHGFMVTASGKISDSRLFPFTGEDHNVVNHLKIVAEAFVQLQEKRHIADYDNGTFWTPTEALAEVSTAFNAFASWKRIKEESIAQDYLASLLIKPRPKARQ